MLIFNILLFVILPFKVREIFDNCMKHAKKFNGNAVFLISATNPAACLRFCFSFLLYSYDNYRQNNQNKSCQTYVEANKNAPRPIFEYNPVYPCF